MGFMRTQGPNRAPSVAREDGCGGREGLCVNCNSLKRTFCRSCALLWHTVGQTVTSIGFALYLVLLYLLFILDRVFITPDVCIERVIQCSYSS